MTMTWQDFIKDISGKRGLSPKEEETLLAKFPKEDECLDEDTVAAKLQISLATVKARMKKVCDNFAGSCEDLANCQTRGRSDRLHKFLRQQYRESGGSIVPPKPDGLYSDEFKALIQEKIERFCGREFVFDAFDQFIQDNPKGYFTVIGDAGMGKTALSAKLVSDRKYPHYFNVLSENRNTPDLFLRRIREQLIGRYSLENAEADNLPALLEKASQKLPAGEQLILVIDALDEVNQESGSNLLYLPMTLPERVYIFLTRRPYTLTTKRLNLSPGVPFSELDLREEKYMKLSEIDIKAYIRLILQDPKYQKGLERWMKECELTPDHFVEQVADKSENNFMYLRYLLPAIAEGQYNDLQLADLPQGLDKYYQQHWERMGMQYAPQEFMVIILFILKEMKTPVTSKIIADIAEQDKYDVEDLLEETWVEYVSSLLFQGAKCYKIYHTSFLDFLDSKRELDRERRLFQEVNRRMAEYFKEYRQNKKSVG
ncbi:NACHT domain-containing protein [Roseofilum sp. BLCC_M154]|uniref:NACHT domain-containing protein n=1 Tax=Roseofilum acuticapitatum BLCC-M154 TaxID=3022444 RepID=A0ABT7AU54_9CYAN|nr:NACHT domain-containing protein [Roseofilum acuticapitatum]MDJ1169851.1 NACHT domain-containing protein [Roseofilum acuticapitatum BLCC-M154]